MKRVLIRMIHFILVVAALAPLLSACDTQPTRRPVSNLNDDYQAPSQSRTALSGNSNIQIYGTINAGYGHSRTKTTVRGADGSKSTIRSSRTGMHSW